MATRNSLRARARGVRAIKTVITVWTDPHSGIKFTVHADHSLTEAEMRERTQWAGRLQADLRSGAKPLVTTMHDRSDETPNYILQGHKQFVMNRGESTLRNSVYLDTQLRRLSGEVTS